MGENILPTGTCFDDAMDFLAVLCKESPLGGYQPGLFLVHGICEKGGEPFSHAWCEQGEMVWFSGIFRGEKGMLQTTKKEYYAEMVVTRFTRYSPAEAAEEYQRSISFGPWLDCYIKLTRQGREQSELPLFLRMSRSE